MMKMIYFLVFFVSSLAFSHSSICVSPGVFRTSDGFAICKYNLQGELTYQIVPCPANTEYSGSSNRCEVLKREKRDASKESESSESVESDSVEEGINTAEIDPMVSESVPNDSTTAGSSDQPVSSSTGTADSSVPTGQTGSEEPTEQTASGSTQPTGQTEGPTDQTASEGTDQTASEGTAQTASGSTDQTSTEPTDEPTVSTSIVTDSTPPGPVEPPTCRFPGVMCTSCTEGVWCVGTGTIKNGIPFIAPVLDIKCNQGEICQDFRGCVSDKTNLCTIADFICTDDGMYPDPYDCTVFHSCISFDGKFLQNDIKCATGAYDAKTGTCGYPINTPNCLNRPIPHCNAPFEMGALPTNPSIYYICIKKGKTLSPSLFRCPGGTKFTTALFSCV